MTEYKIGHYNFANDLTLHVITFEFIEFPLQIKMPGTLTQTDASFTINWKIPKFLDKPESKDKFIVSLEVPKKSLFSDT